MKDLCGLIIFQLTVPKMNFSHDFEMTIQYKDAFQPHILVERGSPTQSEFP